MTKSISDRPGGADLTTAVPTQRIVTSEAVSPVVPSAGGHAAGSHARPESAADPDAVAADLPDLSAVLATVPGGLGAEVVESFTYAGQRWTAADARVSGTPIGLQLAMEQRGLDVSGGLDLPLQRAGS